MICVRESPSSILHQMLFHNPAVLVFHLAIWVLDLCALTVDALWPVLRGVGSCKQLCLSEIVTHGCHAECSLGTGVHFVDARVVFVEERFGWTECKRLKHEERASSCCWRLRVQLDCERNPNCLLLYAWYLWRNGFCVCLCTRRTRVRVFWCTFVEIARFRTEFVRISHMVSPETVRD